jgi:hypothetical protein
MGGGGKSAPAPAPAPAKQDDSAMLALIASMQAQAVAAQEAARRAQEQSVYNASVQSANQAGTQGSQQAMQQLGLLNQSQQAADAAKLTEYQKSSAGAGLSATGGAYDIGGTQKAQLANLGAAAGLNPVTAANTAGGMGIKNPAAMTAGSQAASANRGVTQANQFATPSTTGLTFGGS